jgi:mannose-6-phosphate isomerase-like protein (cupin superfamily)
MNNLTKFNLNEISEKITKPWSPENIETVNESVLAIAKFDGEYHWHKHDKEDELFLVFKGKVMIETKEGNIILKENEGVKIPKGVEHHPVSIEPSIVLLFKPLKLKIKGD